MMPPSVGAAARGSDVPGHPGASGRLSVGRNPAAGMTRVIAVIRTHVRPAGEVESGIEHQFELLSTVPVHTDKTVRPPGIRARVAPFMARTSARRAGQVPVAGDPGSATARRKTTRGR